jgi:hypothetical protein
VAIAAPEMAWNFTDDGAAVFGSTLSGTTPSNNRSLWFLSDGQLSLLVRGGGGVPGFPDEIQFINPFPYPRPRVESDGRTTMNLRATGPGMTAANDQMVYRGNTAELTLVHRESDPAPEGPPGTEVRNNGAYWSSAYGTLIAGDAYQGSNRLYGGLWIAGRTESSLFHRTGEAVPDIRDTFFAHFGNLDDNYPPAARITNSGHALFVATMNGLQVDSTNDRGLWASDPQRRTRLVMREGQAVEVAPGDFRTIGYLPHPVINQSRQIVAVVQLTGAIAPQAVLSATIGCPRAGCDGVDLAGDD